MAATSGRTRLYLAFMLLSVLGLTQSLTHQEKLKELQEDLKTSQQNLETTKVRQKVYTELMLLLHEKLRPVVDFLDQAPDDLLLLVIRKAFQSMLRQTEFAIKENENMEATIRLLDENLKIQEMQLKFLEELHTEL